MPNLQPTLNPRNFRKHQTINNPTPSNQSMKKDSRLSFRLSPRISSKIDLAVKKSKGEIKDRSEFGVKAIKEYLRYMMMDDNEIELMSKVLVAIAEKMHISGEEIEGLKDIIYFSDPVDIIENHPKFEDLMFIRERIPIKEKKGLTRILFSAKYGELDRIYEQFKDVPQKPRS